VAAARAILEDVARSVLLVEDDARVRRVLHLALQDEGYQVSEAATGEEGLRALRSSPPDVVLLDLMLPDIDGFTVCRRIRRDSDAPVIMVTARTDSHDVVAGLEAGADDYVAKPFKAKELIARIKTRLRRSPEEVDQEMLRIGDLVINVDGHTVKRNGAPIQLTPLEFDLLLALARRPWQVFSREVLLEQVWGYRHAADTRLVNVHVQRLRSKIERDPEHPEIVVTVRGIGYKAGEPT
jgi:two-component system, OmpR family, response regulator MtrA